MTTMPLATAVIDRGRWVLRDLDGHRLGDIGDAQDTTTLIEGRIREVLAEAGKHVDVVSEGRTPSILIAYGPDPDAAPPARCGSTLFLGEHAFVDDPEMLADEDGETCNLPAEDPIHTGRVYPAYGSAIPDQPGYVVGLCTHRVARSEWSAGFRVCERCVDDGPVHETAPPTAVVEHPHADIIANLREIADLIEAHPDIPMPDHIVELTGALPPDADMGTLAKILGDEVRTYVYPGDGHRYWVVSHDFGKRTRLSLAARSVTPDAPRTPPATCGPANPRPDSAATFPVTPRRLRLLADVRAGLVYAEAGKAYHDNGQVVTAQIVQALVARWVCEGTLALGRTNRRVYELTPAGQALLSPGGAS